MVQKLFYVLIALPFLMISGCSNDGEVTTVTIDSIDVLKLDSNADIFQYDGVIYKISFTFIKQVLSLKIKSNYMFITIYLTTIFFH
ncbi:hypothetical protein [Psychrobacillus sp. FSL H8-0510]|uniref:hypothetical protein n=1 Tax=Psychrobacillus sp. FSL H8-0510 TaxID=2921394 RepID=UPI0030F69005